MAEKVKFIVEINGNEQDTFLLMQELCGEVTEFLEKKYISDFIIKTE